MNIIPIIPHILALLNTTSAILVSLGIINIHRKNKTIHKVCMISALTVSMIFSLLASHVILAAIVLPMVLITAGFAIAGKFSFHKRIARWTFPFWIYVSVSGVIIYIMSFHIYTR